MKPLAETDMKACLEEIEQLEAQVNKYYLFCNMCNSLSLAMISQPFSAGTQH